MDEQNRRQVSIQMVGPLMVIRMRGGGDCLWLHMYLDMENWQMTCDSDVGSYAYYWGKQQTARDFFVFCKEWLADENWLLRKCVGERHGQRDFLKEKAAENLRRMVIEYNEGDEDFDMDDLDFTLAAASGCDDANDWATVVSYEARMRGVDLPEEWYECIEEDYTPMQKRFAEICRETIVPELKKIIGFSRKMIHGGRYKG